MGITASTPIHNVDLNGLRYSLVTGFCEHYNGLLCSIKAGNFFTIYVTINLRSKLCSMESVLWWITGILCL